MHECDGGTTLPRASVMLIECCKFLLPSSFCECMLPLLHTIFGPGVGGVDVVGCCDQSTSRMSSCKGKNEHTQLSWRNNIHVRQVNSVSPFHHQSAPVHPCGVGLPLTMGGGGWSHLHTGNNSSTGLYYWVALIRLIDGSEVNIIALVGPHAD